MRAATGSCSWGRPTPAALQLGNLMETRAAGERLMRNVPSVQIEGLRKTYVRRSYVAAYLEARTFTKTEVPA